MVENVHCRRYRHAHRPGHGVSRGCDVVVRSQRSVRVRPDRSGPTSLQTIQTGTRPLTSGESTKVQFESPLQAANERAKAQAFVESTQLLATAAQIDPNVRFDFNLDTAFRDALSGVSPAGWIATREQADAGKLAAAQMQQAADAAHALAEGAEVATRIGDAAQSIKRAGVV